MWVCADTVAALNMGGAHCRIPSKVHRTSTGRNPVQCKVQSAKTIQRRSKHVQHIHSTPAVARHFCSGRVGEAPQAYDGIHRRIWKIAFQVASNLAFVPGPVSFVRSRRSPTSGECVRSEKAAICPKSSAVCT